MNSFNTFTTAKIVWLQKIELQSSEGVNAVPNHAHILKLIDVSVAYHTYDSKVMRSTRAAVCHTAVHTTRCVLLRFIFPGGGHVYDLHDLASTCFPGLDLYDADPVQHVVTADT